MHAIQRIPLRQSIKAANQMECENVPLSLSPPPSKHIHAHAKTGTVADEYEVIRRLRQPKSKIK